MFRVTHVKEFSLLFLFSHFSYHITSKKLQTPYMSVTTWKTSSWTSLQHSVSEREMCKRKWEITYSFSRWTRWASFTWRTWWTLQWKIMSSVVTKDKVIVFIKCNKLLQYVGPLQWTERKDHKCTERSIPDYSTNNFLGWSFEIFNSFCCCTKCSHSFFSLPVCNKIFQIRKWLRRSNIWS